MNDFTMTNPSPTDAVLSGLPEDYVRRVRPDLLNRWRELRKQRNNHLKGPIKHEDRKDNLRHFPEVAKRSEMASKRAHKGHRHRARRAPDARLEALEMVLRGAIRDQSPVSSIHVKEDLLKLVLNERRRLAEEVEGE